MPRFSGMPPGSTPGYNAPVDIPTRRNIPVEINPPRAFVLPPRPDRAETYQTGAAPRFYAPVLRYAPRLYARVQRPG